MQDLSTILAVCDTDSVNGDSLQLLWSRLIDGRTQWTLMGCGLEGGREIVVALASSLLTLIAFLLRTTLPRQPSPNQDDGRNRYDLLGPQKGNIIAKGAECRHARLRVAQGRQTKEKGNRKR